MRDAIKQRFLEHAETLQGIQDATALYWITWVFAIGNIALGYWIWILRDAHTLLTTKAHLTLRFWAVVFVVLGLVMAYSLVKRRQRMLRLSLISALFVKMTWLIALSVSVLNGANGSFTTIWLMITLIQLVVFLYTPKETAHESLEQ